MTQFTMTIHAYDSHGLVRCVVRVNDMHSASGPHRLVLALDEDFVGIGQDDPREWFQDVLKVLGRRADL